MAKKSSGSSVRGMRAKKNAKAIPDSQIDFSDIPELSDAELARGRRPGRPLIGLLPRRLIAIRLDQQILDAIKRQAKKSKKGYQTLINEILAEHFTKRKVA